MNAQNHETLRLAALHGCDVLDTPPEEAFDRLTAFAAKTLGVPVALISLIDNNRQFFKSHSGLKGILAQCRETPLSHSFCKHVVADEAPLIVPDARLDSRLKLNPAVTEFGVVAYAGVPLVDTQGFCLGSLCAVDERPRSWGDSEIALLQTLAAQTMMEIELRKKAHALEQDVRSLRNAAEDHGRHVRLTVHDLRSPLTSLLLCLEMLSQTEGISEEQAEYLGLGRRSGETLKLLVDDLLDLEAVKTRGAGALKRSICDPLALFGNALAQVSGLVLKKKLRVERHFPNALPVLSADEAKLERVLVNLLSNAIKFTPEGGWIRLRVSTDSDRLRLSVSDSGVGFDMKDRDRIFQEGVSLDSHASTRLSTGFGLTLCKQVVAAHEGDIEVQSVPGAGSTFTVVLPMRLSEVGTPVPREVALS